MYRHPKQFFALRLPSGIAPPSLGRSSSAMVEIVVYFPLTVSQSFAAYSSAAFVPPLFFLPCFLSRALWARARSSTTSVSLRH